MKSNKELVSLIIGLVRLLNMLAQFVIVFGIIYEFADRDDIGLRLVAASIGIFLITRDKTEIKYWRDFMRGRRRRRRVRNIRKKMNESPPEQPKQ